MIFIDNYFGFINNNNPGKFQNQFDCQKKIYDLIFFWNLSIPEISDKHNAKRRKRQVLRGINHSLALKLKTKEKFLGLMLGVMMASLMSSLTSGNFKIWYFAIENFLAK